MGRQRSRARAGWPTNLYSCGGGYKYRHPVTRRDTWMGCDQARAFAAAKKLNALLMTRDDLMARVLGDGQTVFDAIRVFRADDMPARKWAPKTAEVYKSVLGRIERDLGKQPLESLSVKICAQFIRAVTDSPRARQQFRLVLSWVLACAIEEGWIDNNPALQTRKFAYERQRQRLTIEQYRQIWAAAAPWLQNAMDLSLLTLLRREDVASARFADIREGKLWIVPAKTEGTTGLRLRITIDGALAELIARCRDDVLSPYLIHRVPERQRSREHRAAARDHHTQLMPEQITREFADVREGVGITGRGAPTFHEIRSLGGSLLEQAGWSVKQIQSLMGHADEAMTSLYLSGHETPWTDVQIGLSLQR